MSGVAIIPLVDHFTDVGNVIGTFNTADEGATLLLEEKNYEWLELLAPEERPCERDDPDYELIVHWQLFRDVDGRYVYASWHYGNPGNCYCGCIVPAKWAASMVAQIGYKPSDELLAACADRALLTDTEQAADDAIRRDCKSLKEINKATGIDVRTLTNHIIPALKKKRGLLSKPYRYP